ncbi:hypothetical protein D3C79_856780 [compost metagenome]
MITVITPADKEILEPYITRENTSRPSSSVPKKCEKLGGWYRMVKSCTVVLCVAINGAQMTTIIQNAQMNNPSLKRNPF